MAILFYAPDSEVSVPGNDANTLVLLHMDGANNGTVFTDSSSYERTVSRTDIVTKTNTKKFGTASGYFPGSGGLTVPDSTDWDFGTGGKNFTFDCWFRMADLTPGYNQYIMGQWTDGSNTAALYFHQTYGMRYNVNGSPIGGVLFDQGDITGWVVDIWYHVALVKNGNDYQIYRDGTSIAQSTNSNVYAGQSSVMAFGARADLGSSWLGGYMDEIRFSDVARWTTDFDPPTGPYGP